MEGCRESYDSAMPQGMRPWRAPRGGLPLHGKYQRGTCLAYPQAKRAEGQDVLKEGGRLCALSGSAGGAWVEVG